MKKVNSLEKPQLSLVIPVYNEEDHIAMTIEKTDRIMEEIGVEYEIIVVNDGSRDETGFRILECAHDNGHLKVVSYYKNMGKGHALKMGFSSAVGDSVIFIDSDLEIDPAQIKSYIAGSGKRRHCHRF